MSIEQLITDYGYPVLLIGTLLEGETIVVLAGFLAHRGYLSLQWVILVAFLGTFASDQFFFHLGRRKGGGFLEKKISWQTKSRKVFDLLQRHQTPVIIGFRFLYGLRTITPFVLGMSGVSTYRYLLLNGLGAFLWATAIACLGYAFGNLLELLLEEMRRYERLAAAGICIAGFVVWVVSRLRDRRLSHPRGG